MKISTINNSNNLSFKGQRLYPVKLMRILPDKKIKYIDAFFTKMDKSDIELAKAISPIWEKESRFGKTILSGFLDRHLNEIKKTGEDFFMIEVPEAKTPLERIKALAVTSQLSGGTYIDLIQSGSQIKSLEKLKGAGKMILFGIMKQAQKTDKTPLILEPTPLSEKWYQKLQFEELSGTHLFMLSESKIEKLIKKLKNEYNL